MVERESPRCALSLLDELAAAERLLRGHPEAGMAYATHRAGVVRRILLGGTKYYLYYRYHAERDELVVLTVWGAVRERGPKL